MFTERREASLSDDTHLTPSQHLGVLPQDEYMKITGNKVVLNLTGSNNMKHVEPNDFVIHLRSFQGGIEHSTHRGKVSNAYTVLRPGSDVDPRYFRWVLKAPGFVQELATTAEQLRDGQSIRFDQFARVGLPLPPLDEQRRISDFLDDQVARIDALGASRKSQIRALDEAVDASAGELFSALAARCGVAPLKRFVGRIEQGGSPLGGDAGAAGDLAVLKTTAIKAGRFNAGENKVLLNDANFEPRYEVRDGDVLVVRGSGSGDLVADVAWVRLPSDSPRIMLSDLVYRLVAAEFPPSFLVAAMLAPQARSQIRALVRQGSGPAKARGEDVLAIHVPCAGHKEQAEFAAAYWQLRDRQDRVVEKLRDGLELLNEYKRSLITGAVTGEFDVTTARRGVPA